MIEDFSERFYDIAVKKELERQKIRVNNLAERHAIRMLNEILKIVESNDPTLSSDKKLEKIFKILVFCNVPPHI